MSQFDYDIVKRIARARLAVCLVLQLVMFSAADAAETSVVPIGEHSREEIVSFFTENEFGRRPADAERPLLDLRFERTDDDAPLLGGTVMRRRSRVVYAGPYATNSFPVTVFIPTDVKEPAPAFLLVCQRREGFDDCLGDADDYFPVGEIVRRGFAAAVFRTWDVAPDFNTGNTHGVFTAFERPGPYRDNRLWGTLSAWAWGASRALDLIETMPDVDASKVAVVGHSRGGKAALWAAVTDTRFAMACVNGSGCAGAKLNHIDLPKSEHIAQIARTFPYWFCSDYILWANREKEMPFDQHELLSCIAPRLLAVGSGSKDVWAGPDGERMATELARAAWADASRVSYHCHDGGHDLGLVDWDAYLSHAERFWKRRWPFIAIRHTSAVNAMPEVFAQLMESHFRNPGACDEFWFCCGGRKTPDAIRPGAMFYVEAKPREMVRKCLSVAREAAVSGLVLKHAHRTGKE